VTNGRAPRPLFSILTATWNTEPRFLTELVTSVLDQEFQGWEWCVVDDGSTRPETLALLQRLAGLDPRIRVSFLLEHSGISVAQNVALSMTRGRFVALVDHDDLLDPGALRFVAREIAYHPDADMLYTDEDRIDTSGQRLSVIYKPAWAPEFLLACPYINHLTVYRRELMIAGGAFRTDYAMAQDWALALRVTALTDRIHHVPLVLYHYRQYPASAGRDATAAAYWRRKCHADHVLDRFGPDAVSRPAYEDATFFTERPIRGRPLVSVIIPTAGRSQRLRGETVTLVTHCVRSILDRTAYPEFEILCIVDPRTPSAVRADLQAIAPARVRPIDATTEFNYSERLNLGAQHARGAHLVLLNDDTEVVHGDWLRAMLELSQDPDIGVVGPKLRYPDGRVQSLGITVLPGAYSYPVFWGYPAKHPGHAGSLTANREYAALSGACQMTRAEVFAELGGYDEQFPVNHGDIDYCLRARDHGYRVVGTPRAELFHYEFGSRDRAAFRFEHELMRERWGDMVDPYWHPHAETAQSYFLEYEAPPIVD
jgi:GT2 family glycosyltransferase